MKQNLGLELSSLLLLPFALSSADIALRPEQGTHWRKSFTVEQELELEQFRVVLQGQEVPAEFLPQLDLSTTSKVELAFLDGYGAVEGGRPLSLVRDYEAIGGAYTSSFSMEGGGAPSQDHDSEIGGTSALAGKTVAFEWDSSAEEYARHEQGEAADESLLAGLVEETDMRSWLPPEETAVGSSWKLPAANLDALLRPGGDLAIVRTGEGAEYWREDRRSRELQGEIELTLAAIDGEGDARRAHISIGGEVREVIEREGDLSHVPVAKGSATEVNTSIYRLEGELVWDLAAGMPYEASLAARVELDSVTTKDEGEPEYEHSMLFRGNLKIEMECRAAR
jgi:hypothetical protein